MQQNQIVCLPKGDLDKRFVLSKPGKRNLMVVGLNPSTANENKLDPTSRNIEKIASNNGYDGWILVNLYPARCSHPNDLPLQMDEALFWKNISTIVQVLSADQLKVNDVLLAWGNNIDKIDRTYIKKAAYYLHQRLEPYAPEYFCIATTKAGHPMHPSPQAINLRIPGGTDSVRLITWNFKSYASSLKMNIRPKPYLS